MTRSKLLLTSGRLGRRMLVLLVVALLAVPVLQAAQRLRVNIDGDVLHVLSFDATVGDVLEEQGVLLAAGDEVLPAPDTPLDQVSAITVLRTIEVTLDVDGVTTAHRGTWRSVEGLLADEGITVAPTQVLRPVARTPLEDGDTVTITSPRTVTLEADGQLQQLATHLATVGELLDNAGAEVRPDDILSPVRATPLTDGLEISVRRVGFDEVTEEVALPFDEETRETADLFTDQSRVAQEGEAGLRIDTYRVMIVDGEPTERALVAQEVVREPVTRIVERGTAERPPRRMADDGSVWYDLAQCESGGRWDYNGSSGYDGGLQFHPSTWTRNKLAGYPEYAWQASPSQQIEVGKRVQARAGWGAWPSCARKLGLL